MRQLATIREIREILPIEGADFIELAKVDGWQCVVKKGEFAVGDKAVYFEIDSLIPRTPWSEFLFSDRNSEVVRLKTKKLKGNISQGLLIPIYSFNELAGIKELIDVTEAVVDVSELLNIEKYEPFEHLGIGSPKGSFPPFIFKTDEERIQNLPLDKIIEEMETLPFYVTEKLDGSSVTVFFNEGEYGVCSRNNWLKLEPSRWVTTAESYGLEEKLKGLNQNIALQGELLGPGIQGNKYKLTNYEIYFFNLFDITKQEYLPFEFLQELCMKFGLKTVPEIIIPAPVPKTINEFLTLAEGKSVLNKNTEREGLVFRHISKLKRRSFKVISNKFLLKNDG